MRSAREQIGAAGLAAPGIGAVAVTDVQDGGILRITQRIVVTAFGEVVGGVIPGTVGRGAARLPVGIGQQRQCRKNEARAAEEVGSARFGCSDGSTKRVGWRSGQG